MDDGDDSRGLPTDFPSDPVFHFHFIFWFFALLVLACLVAALWYGWTRGRESIRRSIDKSIRARVAIVFQALKIAASASGAALVPAAQESLDAIGGNFAATLALSSELNKRISKLYTALDGTEDREAETKNLFGGAAIAGGTVINIAVNQGPAGGHGDAVQNLGPGGATASSAIPDAAALPPLTSEGRLAGVWKAVQKLYDYWKNDNAVTAAFTAAQQQLLNQSWEEPRIDLALLSDVLARKKA